MKKEAKGQIRKLKNQNKVPIEPQEPLESNEPQQAEHFNQLELQENFGTDYIPIEPTGILNNK